MNPLQNAIQAADLESVNRHLQENPELASSRDENGASMLQLACYHGFTDAAKAIQNLIGLQDIWDACTIGDQECVGAFLAEDPELRDRLSPDGFTPLCLAAAFRHESLVRYLTDAGANPNLRSRALGGVAPLDAAVFGGSVEVVDALLDAKADPNSAQEGGFRPLHGAAQNGNAEMVDVLLQHNADPALLNDKGQTASDLAFASGHLDIAKLLLIAP